ncbi:hypothetical protein SNE40_004417 [Patella caerulea]
MVLVKERKSTFHINRKCPIINQYVDFKHGCHTADVLRPSIFIEKRKSALFDDTPFELKYDTFLERLATKPSVTLEDQMNQVTKCKQRIIKDYPRFLNPFDDGYYYRKKTFVTNDIEDCEPFKDDNLPKLVKSEISSNSNTDGDNNNIQDKTEEIECTIKSSKNIFKRLKRRITKSFRSLFKTY